MTLVIAFTFFVLLVIGAPIAFSLGIAGIVGFLLYDSALLQMVPQRMYAGVDSFPLMAVPFFILAGDLMGTTGILARLIRLAECLVGHIRGGLAHAYIVAAMVFSGISGSAIADASALGTALIPPMAARYNLGFAAGLCAAAATIGPIIPPSIAMVVYAFIVGQVSVGGLFLAGVVPGLLIGLGMMVITYVIAVRRGYEAERRRATGGELWHASREAAWALLMPIIILGGILGGLFTATEAAAVAVAYAILVGCFVTGELRIAHIYQALSRCVVVSAAVFILVATSSIVSWVLTISMVPATLSTWLRSLTDSPAVFLLLVNVLMLVIGCLLDNVAAMIMIAPVLAPIARDYGIDPLHFGFVFIFNSVIGLLTPPVGAVLFTVCGIAKLPIERVARETLPFLLWQLALLAIVTYVPFVSLGLPRLFGYGR
jgi:tripartite ATP-independent transporter DctM subunit